MERLHKFIARCGISSRRAAETLIAEGRVMVNGEPVIEMGVKVSEDDIVEVDGAVLKVPRLHYVLMNKPKGVVTTLRDPQGRPTISQYLPQYEVPLKPVGRLDMDTSGLLICTNDGELASRLAHPRYGIEKEYRAVVKGDVTDKTCEKMSKGIFLEGRKTAPAQVLKLSYEPRNDTSMLKLILHEGRYRQVRLMCAAMGHPVEELRRTRLAFLTNSKLAAGQCRLITKSEVDRLKGMVGLGEEDTPAPKPIRRPSAKPKQKPQQRPKPKSVMPPESRKPKRRAR